MRYRLGRFTPRPGSSDYDSLHLDPRIGPLLTEALQHNLQVRLSPPSPAGAAGDASGDPRGPGTPNLGAVFVAMSRSAGRKPEQAPDLLRALPKGDPDRKWVEAVHRRLRKLSRRFDIRLLACEREPGGSGFLAIAATSPALSADVRPRDTVWGGFVALRDSNRPVSVRARIFRLVCRNGSLVSVHEDGVEPADGVEEHVERCFDHARFMSAVEALRMGAAQRLEDPASRLDEMEYLLHRGLIERRWREEGDRTVFGLINAITSVARDVPDMRERLDLEGMAGSLARVAPPPRTRQPDPAVELVPV
jgi:hypothetical protein